MTGHQSLDIVWAHLNRSPLLWLTLTLVAYVIAQVICKAMHRHPLANPVLIAVAMLIVLLRSSQTPYPVYMQGGQFIHFLLGPAIVALAVPLHKHLPQLRRLLLPLLGGLLAGCATAIVSAVLIARLLGATGQTLASIAPKSATAAIAIRLSEHIGGLPPLTAVLVIMTGITGAVIGVPLLNALRLSRHDIVGFALGVASHGIGTARAFQLSEEAGALAGLGMGLNGVLTSFVLPVLYPALRMWG